jgi:hypothetical protein
MVVVTVDRDVMGTAEACGGGALQQSVCCNIMYAVRRCSAVCRMYVVSYVYSIVITDVIYMYAHRELVVTCCNLMTD